MERYRRTQYQAFVLVCKSVKNTARQYLLIGVQEGNSCRNGRVKGNSIRKICTASFNDDDKDWGLAEESSSFEISCSIRRAHASMTQTTPQMGLCTAKYPNMAFDGIINISCSPHQSGLQGRRNLVLKIERGSKVCWELERIVSS